jgi:protein-S-isoprenylcysteine O-methyltransferase Ste14
MLTGVLFVRREIWELHIFDVTLPFWQEGLLLPLSAIDGAISGFYGSRKRNVEHTPAYQKALLWGTPTFFVLYVACAALCERLHVGIFIAGNEVARTFGVAVVVAGLGLRIWSQMCAPSLLMKDEHRQPTEPQQSAQLEEASPEERAAEQDVAEGGDQPEPPEQGEIGEEQSADATAEKIARFVQKIAASGASATPLDKPIAAEPLTPEQSLKTLLELTDGQFPNGPHRLVRYPDSTGRLIALCGIPLCFGAWLPLFAIPGIIVLLKWHINDQEAFRISQLGEPYLEYRKSTWSLVPYIY